MQRPGRRHAATDPGSRPRRNRRMVRGAGLADPGRRPRTGRLCAAATAGAGHRAGGARAGHHAYGLSQHHRGRPGAALSRQPVAGRAHRLHQPLERAGHGGARQPGPWRTGRPHRQLCVGGRPVRSGFQPFLPRARARLRRRPGLHAAALGAGHLCPRLSGRFPERRRPGAFPPGNHGRGTGTARPVFLSAPLADAGLLAIPHRLDGHRPHQCHLPGPLHALPRTPFAGHAFGPQGLGHFRRRGNGRTRIHRRADAGRARAPGQPGVRDQLQPAAPRRPGTRQWPHHRRAGNAVRRRRLECHQAGLGRRLGRPAAARSRWRAGRHVLAHGGRAVPDLRRQ
ncbi:Uncharacterised protein [Bordetella pertussis]|nr:Uncharacterised protein [Bordetella pertussis]CFM03219.1 Uncharacterised protein [Bordetella pertussis]CFM34019.1 Uncharacterised protein [Bordetella pertussis]CFM93313.1 Uncharacterised protein [Bordetella pertussis]CFM95664.1 Uncharacterised protein [Bordetella pertussis]